MARSARKPKTSSRSTGSRKTARSSSRTSSTAKSVRGRSSSARTSRSRSSASVSRKTNTAKKSTKRTVTRTKKKSVRSTQNRSAIAGLVAWLKVGLLTFLGVVALIVLVWFFLLPSVLLHTNPSKNILYVSDDINSLKGKIAFAHIDEESEKSQLFILDGTEVVEVPNGYGEYAVGVVPSLLAMDDQSPEMITSIMSRILEVPIDVVIMDKPLIITDESNMFSSQHIAGQLQSVAFSNIANPGRFLSILRLSMVARSTQEINLNSYQDAGTLLETSSVVLSPEEKECSVAVINATGVSQLARNTADLLEKNGVYVVREDSVSTNLDTTVLELSAELSASCEAMVTKITPFFPVSSSQVQQSIESQRYRADIVIFLGKDIVTSGQEN